MRSLAFLVAFVAYAIGAVALGAFVRHRERRARKDNPDVFWAAERGLPGWAAGLSLSASMLSISWSCVYGVQLIYRFGLSGVWLLSVPWLLVLSVYFLLAPRIRAVPAFSQPEMAARRFGDGIRWLLAPALAFVFIAWCGAEIYAAGRLLAPFVGISAQSMMIAIALIVAAYTTLGGFPSVVATDIIQFAFVSVFLAVMSVAALLRVSGRGGFWSAIHAAPHPPSAPGGVFDLLAAGLPFILITFAAYLPGWLAETDIWIRISATRNARETRTAMGVTIVNSFLFVLGAPAVIGLAALILYPAAGGHAPVRLAGGEAIFSVFLQDLLPTALAVPLTMGLLAAGMSTIDSTANVVALSLGYDLVLPWRRRRRPDTVPESMRISRLVNAVSVALALAFALNERSLLDIFYLASGVLSAGVFPAMLALFWPGARKEAAFSASGAGLAAIFGFYLWERYGNLPRLLPVWLAETDVAYILAGLVFAAVGFLFGQIVGRRRQAGASAVVSAR